MIGLVGKPNGRCWVFRMYDVGCKFLNGIKSMYVNSLACVRVKVGKSECFMIDSSVRQGCIMSPCLFNVYIDGVMKEGKIGRVRMGLRFLEVGRECRLRIHIRQVRGRSER